MSFMVISRADSGKDAGNNSAEVVYYISTRLIAKLMFLLRKIKDSRWLRACTRTLVLKRVHQPDHERGEAEEYQLCS